MSSKGEPELACQAAEFKKYVGLSILGQAVFGQHLQSDQPPHRWGIPQTSTVPVWRHNKSFYIQCQARTDKTTQCPRLSQSARALANCRLQLIFIVTVTVILHLGDHLGPRDIWTFHSTLLETSMWLLSVGQSNLSNKSRAGDSGGFMRI